MDSNIIDAIFREFKRIGLRHEDIPGLGMSAGSEMSFLAHLQSLPEGATWRDALPDWPAHWIPGRPETWTSPYHPLGAYDYQTLPTGPAVHVHWPKDTDRGCLDRLLSAARDAGWRIHGADFLDITNPEWPSLDAMLVLEHTTSQDELDEFLEWLSARNDVQLSAVSRLGDEDYFSDQTPGE